MQNQAAVEALYSATMVEDYLDVVENLPNELQRHLSALRELDMHLQREFLWELETLLEALDKETTVTGQRQVLSKIRKGLIAAQDIGDDKLRVAQAIADTIENKSRLLEHDAKNLDFADEDEEEEQESERKPSSSRGTAGSAGLSTGQNGGGGGADAKGGADRGGGGAKGSGTKATKRHSDASTEKQAKRRKKQAEKSSNRDDDDDDSVPSGPPSKSSSRSRSLGGGQSGGGGGSQGGASGKRPGGGGVKRKQTRKGGEKSKDDDNSDDKEIDPHFDIDPDEPTYCLCDQVSYGDMIGCDNDLCPIEWFHFNCVNLTHKPKGKWFCPRCRGDKPTVMKPKAQFLKELEKYNKEREEKMSRQNNG